MKPAHPADRTAHGREDRRLDEELHADVARRAPSARRTPILAVRSVTETSIDVHDAMPPTISAIEATPAAKTKMPPESLAQKIWKMLFHRGGACR
jgi:hypothetical protein